MEHRNPPKQSFKPTVALILCLSIHPCGASAMLGSTHQAQAAAAEAQANQPNKLVTGKIIYVASMPGDLDRWISEDLNAWRKYRVTANPEGVDLVIRAREPDKETQYKLNRQGLPQPKKERAAPPVLSISVIDWVTNHTLCQVNLTDRKLKKDEPEPVAGPQMSVSVRGLTTDQIAQKFVTKLREYVEGLEKAESSRQ